MSEREEIILAIKRKGTITKAAEYLGLARRTLQDRMRSLGLGESKDRANVLGGLGRRGRRKKKFSRHKRAYAAVASITAAAVAVGLGVAITRKKASSASPTKA